MEEKRDADMKEQEREHLYADHYRPGGRSPGAA